MNEPKRGERLFRAWRAALPAYDADAGRARLLAAQAARHRQTPRRWVMTWAAAFAVAAVAFAVVWSRTTTVTFRAGDASGEMGAWLATGPSSALPLVFSEGTRVVLEPSSRGRVEDVARDGATFLLERGDVRANVVHRATTSWRFRAGPFNVRVTGTRFGMRWDPEHERFAVTMEEGSVTVEGPSIGAAQVVRAGERLVVDVPSRTSRVSSVDDEPRLGLPMVDAGAPVATDEIDAAVAPPSPPPSPTNSGVVRRRETPSPPAASGAWTKLEERGDYAGAYAAAAASGLADVLAASTADELLRFAQVALLSGHAATQRQALVACRDRFPGTRESAVAAYELGRLSHGAEAALWFRAYLGEDANGALAREAAGRLVEAYVEAGDDAHARESARRYLARYPNGPHAPLARRIAAGAR